jgi:hypothetical protein
LIEVPAIDPAGVDVAGLVFRLLNQEGAADEDFATGSAAGAFALAPRQQSFVVAGIDICQKKPAYLSYSLTRPKPDSADGWA